MDKKKLVSIVLPVYNEEDNISSIYHELLKVLAGLDRYDFEMIMVNDGSIDNSWQQMLLLARNDKRLKIINFTRNFGHQIALTAGYDNASGDAVISMDADLQHPPECIPRMLQAWEDGFYIVYVRNIKTNHSFLKKYTAIIHYKILDAISYIKIPRHVQDFRLIDKKVLDVLIKTKEKSRYLRGIVAWTGFKATYIDGVFSKRFSGNSAYSWTKMFKLSFDGMTGFSLFPLKIACYMGLFVICTGLLMFCYITLDALVNNVRYPLFKWLVTIIYIFIGVLFILLWLIGEYIGRIYEELKNRPLYIIEERYNF